MHEIGWHYERSRTRIDDLLRPADADAWDVPVLACPGWRVRDVVAHLLGNTEDAAAGRLDGPPTEVQTQDQIDRHRDDDPVTLLDAWAEVGPFVAAVVTQTDMWPAAIDVVSHEHDIRGALTQPGARDDASITELAELMRTFDTPRPVSVAFDADEPSDGDALRLRTTAFELVRLRMGRRSRRQVEALDWSDDPTDVLPHLFIFGPSPTDIVE
jgi:uncharacterized protein (TIGR03083 family)